MARIAELRTILGDEARVYALVREELLEVRAQHADERRTLIEDVEGEIDVEALIADEPMVIAITRDSLRQARARSTSTACRAAAASACAACR